MTVPKLRTGTPRAQATDATYTPPPARSRRVLKVRAIQTGYYDDKLRRVGDVFEIDAASLEEVIAREFATGTLQPVDRERGPNGKYSRKELIQMALEDDKDLPKPARDAMPAGFSKKWMEVVDRDTPESITSHNEMLRRQHDEEITARSIAADAKQDNPLGA